MATLYGLNSSAWATGLVGTSPHVLSGAYAYRRSDDYLLGAGIFGSIFDTAADPAVVGTTFEESGDGSVRCDYVDYYNSQGSPGTNISEGALISGDIEFDDSRVTYSLAGSVSTATMFSGVPTKRWESSQLAIQTNRDVWEFKIPLPLSFGLLFSGGTYTAKAKIPALNVTLPGGTDSGGANGRFVHRDVFYSGGGPQSAMCAVHGTYFATFDQEKAHNSLSFTLAGGGAATTFNGVTSTVDLAPDNGGGLTFTANTEVDGSFGGRAYYPAITRLTAEFTEANRLRVDCSNIVSPTADVVGVFLRDSEAPEGTGRPAAVPGLPPRLFIDHYEAGGVPISIISTEQGDYVPATIFDIVFTENEGTRTGYFEVRTIIDSPALPPEDDTLQVNWQLSIPALLYAVIGPFAEDSDAGMLVRPSGEIKTRENSVLWQHREGHMWAGETTTGAIYNSANEGANWTLITNAWTGVDGAGRFSFTSLPRNGAISIAKVGDDIKSRYSPDGKTWQDPATVCPAGTTGKWTIASHEYSGSDAVSVMNLTTNERYDSADRGATWQEVTS